MLVGVFHERWVEPVAAVLGELGVKRGLVTHCRAGCGMDEITTAGQVRVRGCGELSRVDAVWLPADFGFKECSVEELRGGTPEENASIFQRLLKGDVVEGLMDTICLTAGAALWVAGRAEDAAAGALRARDIILGGELREQVRRLQECHRVD
jgi:anthranilate phosphoribosyltransferase